MEYFLAIVIVGALVGWFVSIYNSLQRYGNEVKRCRGDIMASMKKRSDLVGRLLDIARSYGDHEKLTQVTATENMSSVFSGLAMAYPELKANVTYQQLMSQLHEIETNLQTRRETYNAAASAYNSKRSSLPQALFSAAIGFPEASFYAVDDSGLESLPEFQTDDGALLKESLQRMGERAGAFAQQAGGRAGELAQQAGRNLNAARSQVKSVRHDDDDSPVENANS